MNKKNYTSLPLSKHLADNGCVLKTKWWWTYVEDEDEPGWNIVKMLAIIDGAHKTGRYFPSYDILTDICKKYATSFFPNSKRKNQIKIITDLMAENKKAEAEEYIKKNCSFNLKIL